MQMSEVEKRAAKLDEARNIRILSGNEIDFDKYVKADEESKKIREVKVWLDELRDDLVNPKVERVVTMPWSKTHMSFNFRAGEVTLYAGSNGGGKSLITGQVGLSLVKQGYKICIASFEMKPKRSIHRMLRQFAGENIDFPKFTNKVTYMSKIIQRFENFGHNKIFFYDQQGTVNPSQVIAVARYCAVELGIEHIFIDSLMKCVSAEDDYNEQKRFVDELTALARDHNVHIHLIHHIRKLQSEELMPNKNDIKGSGAISDQVDNVLLMWRNKKKEHKIQNGDKVDPTTPDAILMCEKQRNGESEDWYNLWYHKDSQQFIESVDSVPMAFDVGGRF
jgi:twinkle protein